LNKISVFVHCQNGFSFGFSFGFSLGFSLGFSYGFMACIWFIGNACFAPQPKCIERKCGTFEKEPFECNCKHRQETNTRQHNATLGHNEQETQIQKPNERMNMFDSTNI